LPRAKSLPDPVIAPVRRDNAAWGVVASVLLHAAVVGSFYLTWPFMQRETVVPPPLIVDLVPISDITAAPPPPEPQQQPTPEPQASPEDMPPPPADVPPLPEEKPPPPPPKEELPAPTPPPPVTPPPPPKPKPPKPKNDMASIDKLLKDLQKKPPKEQTAPQAQSSTGVEAPAIGDRATITEQDAIRRHIEGCWRIDPGKEGIENLSAVIKVTISRDGSVQRAEIVDMVRYFADAQFRTFANGARIDLLACKGIPISAENYERLKDMELNFSPQGRIN